MKKSHNDGSIGIIILIIAMAILSIVVLVGVPNEKNGRQGKVPRIQESLMIFLRYSAPQPEGWGLQSSKRSVPRASRAA